MVNQSCKYLDVMIDDYRLNQNMDQVNILDLNKIRIPISYQKTSLKIHQNNFLNDIKGNRKLKKIKIDYNFKMLKKKIRS